MSNRFLFMLAYGLIWLAAALSVSRRFWQRRDRELAMVALGSSILSAALLAVGLTWRGLEAGAWPGHTAFYRLNVGLLGALLVSMALLSARRDKLVWIIASLAASLVAAVGLWMGEAELVTSVYDGGWRLAYVGLSALGGGALLVAGAASVVAVGLPGQDASNRPRVLARRALAWGLLTLSAGLASGTWWFQRVSGRYRGDGRWLILVAAGLVAGAAWQLRGEWLRGGWRSAVVGALLVICGGFVALGVGGGVG